MKPTVIGTDKATVIPGETPTLATVLGDKVYPAPAIMSRPAHPMTTVALVQATSEHIVLREDQLPLAQEFLSSLDFKTMNAGEITLLGHDAEKLLSQTLDGFLEGIDRSKNPALFLLFDRLQNGVDDAKLPALREQIMSGKLPWGARIRGWFNKKALADAAQKAYTDARDLLSGRTNTLKGVVNGLEQELAKALKDLLDELNRLDQLKLTYRGHIDNFAVVAAASHQFLLQAREAVEAQRNALAGSTDGNAAADLRESEQKLALLDSRVTAMIGVYTKLPADREVIQQIQLAGVQTLQETATTSTARFASIKTALIALHGALQVKGVQQMNQRAADMDRQLGELTQQTVRDVATTAANAPGDNRLAQANQIKKIIDFTDEINTMVKNARESNELKFATARTMFADARKQLATVS